MNIPYHRVDIDGLIPCHACSVGTQITACGFAWCPCKCNVVGKVHRTIAEGTRQVMIQDDTPDEGIQIPFEPRIINIPADTGGRMDVTWPAASTGDIKITHVTPWDTDPPDTPWYRDPTWLAVNAILAVLTFLGVLALVIATIWKET